MVSPWTTYNLCGGIPMLNWYMERLSPSEISTAPKITDYWHRNDPECEMSGRLPGKYFLKAP